MYRAIAALLPLLSVVSVGYFALGAALSPPAGAAGQPANTACSLLTKDLVVQFTPYDKKALDLVMLVPPSGDPAGSSGSECTYGGITLQIDPFSPATLEKQRDQRWQTVKDVGDVAYFRDNGGRWGELYAQAGSRVLTIQMDVPTGRTAMSIHANLVGLAKAGAAETEDARTHSMSMNKSSESRTDHLNTTETVDTSMTPPEPTPKRIKLTTVRGVRRELASVYSDCRQGRLDPSTGSKLTYILTAVAKVLEVSDLEARLIALETKQPPTTGRTLGVANES